MPVKIYFGIPGSGKTTHAAKVVKRNLKRGVPTYSNVDIVGSIPYKTADLGKIYILEGSDLIIDEASIEYNNRQYKSLPKETIAWFKLYRHYGIRNIYIYSQSYDDMDITLRRLSDVMYLVRRSLIPGLIVTKEISRKIGINQDTHQIEDQFFFNLFRISFIFGPRYWKMFDSWSAPPLPKKPISIRGYEKYPATYEVLKQIYRMLPLRAKGK